MREPRSLYISRNALGVALFALASGALACRVPLAPMLLYVISAYFMDAKLLVALMMLANLDVLFALIGLMGPAGAFYYILAVLQLSAIVKVSARALERLLPVLRYFERSKS